MFRSAIVVRRVLLLAIGFAVVATPAWAASKAPTGTCLRASIPATVVLPDGSVHPPGDLVLCLERHLSPVAEFQKISVAGAAQGLFAGRPAKIESDVARPFLVFHRADNDEWILVGFVRPARTARDRATRVRLTDPDRVLELAEIGARERPASAASVPVASGDGGRELLVAASW